MLITWSRHGRGGATQSGPDKLVRYFAAPAWRKAIGTRHVLVPRSPAPEVLIGDARRFRTVAQSVPFKRQYASAILSFAPGDIDVAAFNAGDTASRQAAGIALHLVLESVLPGLPLTLRPAVYATTHTHTGRLEINLAISCGVFDAQGTLRSFNPAPPLKGHRNGLEACRDTLNARFGWADPQDPRRQRLIARPHWEAKATREAQRARMTLPPTSREDLIQELVGYLIEHDPQSRTEVLHAIAMASSHTGYIVSRTTAKSVTLTSPEAPDREITLNGPLFAADFTGPRGAVALAQACDRRAADLADAPARLCHAIARHAAYNATRYGHPPDPATVSRLDRLLDPDCDLPRLIPACHPAYLPPSRTRPAPRTERSLHVTQPHPARTPSPRATPDPRAGDRRTPAEPLSGSLDTADAVERLADLRRTSDRLARRPPDGSRADLTARLAQGLQYTGISARLRWCVTPAGEGIDIQIDPRAVIVWVPGAGLWSNHEDNAHRILRVLKTTFPDQTVGTLHLTHNPLRQASDPTEPAPPNHDA